LFHKTVEVNSKGRDFVVGDLHGMYSVLIRSLDSVNFDASKDRCFSVGDLIDRGPQSKECLSLLDENWFYPVRGNHEQLLIEAVREPRPESLTMWCLNGGCWAIDQSNDYLNEVSNRLLELPLAITLSLCSGNTVGICHAEPPVSDWDNLPIAEQRPELLHKILWGRSTVKYQRRTVTKHVSLTIHGHTIISKCLLFG